MNKWILLVTLRFAPTLHSRTNATQKQHSTETTLFFDGSWNKIRRPCFSGPVASNHGNLYTTLFTLVLRALRITHAEVNGTEEEKGENGDGNGDGNGEGNGDGTGDRNGDGNGKGGPAGAE